MCHLILLLPLLALPLFWMAPMQFAGPAYAVVLVLSGGIYFLAIRAMHRPVQTGVEALLHSRGEVLDKAGNLFRVVLGARSGTPSRKRTCTPGTALKSSLSRS